MEHENDIITVEKPTKENDLFTSQKPAPITPTIKKQNDLFENYETAKYEQVYDKYEVLQSYNPKRQDRNLKDFQKFVDDNNSYQPTKETVTVERVKPKFQFKLKSRAKIFLFAFCAVVVMLSGLMIYNAVQINNLQTDITNTTGQVEDTTVDIDKIIKDIGNLTDEDLLEEEANNMDFSDIVPEDEVTIELLPKNEVTTPVTHTNFFDRICNFFRRLFGG
jgi:cell division protein FtsL